MKDFKFLLFMPIFLAMLIFYLIVGIIPLALIFILPAVGMISSGLLTLVLIYAAFIDAKALLDLKYNDKKTKFLFINPEFVLKNIGGTNAAQAMQPKAKLTKDEKKEQKANLKEEEDRKIQEDKEKFIQEAKEYEQTHKK